MNHFASLQSPQPADRFGHKVALRLSAGAAELPSDITERLRVARMQAVAQRKIASVRPAISILGSLRGGAAVLGFGGDDGLGLWNRIASAVPLVVLVCGLVFIHTYQTDRRASELAEVDGQLLTDDLPPAAYADPGFAQFLRTGGN